MTNVPLCFYLFISFERSKAQSALTKPTAAAASDQVGFKYTTMCELREQLRHVSLAEARIPTSTRYRRQDKRYYQGHIACAAPSDCLEAAGLA